MNRLVIKGGHIVTPVQERFADILITDETITAIDKLGNYPQDALSLDATNCWVTPGLIDLQVNGGPSCDFWGDPTKAQVQKFAEELVQSGVTTILPTLITDGLDHLDKNIRFLESLCKEKLPVRMPGIHLEGPCLSPARPGVHPPEHLKPLNMDVAKRLASPCVKLITLAPELDPTGECLEFLQNHGIHVALGHSNASYEEAQTAFQRGIKMMTHTYNALPAIHHRAPGAVVAALLDDRVMCCVICDGHHVSPPAVELLLRSKGVGKTILVTDIAHVGTTQGTLVGSSIFLDDAVRNVVTWGLTGFTQAIAMSTFNPAQAMGWHDIGLLAVGNKADIVIWDKNTLKIKHVIAGGRLIEPVAVK